MCPHGCHHSGSMATPALGTRDVRWIYSFIIHVFTDFVMSTTISYISSHLSASSFSSVFSPAFLNRWAYSAES